MADGDTDTTSLRWFKQMGIALAYIIPAMWMQSEADFPDSFGVHLTGSGRAETIESWWYSYLLLSRPNALDLILFCYMWAPFVGAIIWMGYPTLRKRGFKLKIYDDDGPPEEGS